MAVAEKIFWTVPAIYKKRQSTRKEGEGKKVVFKANRHGALRVMGRGEIMMAYSGWTEKDLPPSVTWLPSLANGFAVVGNLVTFIDGDGLLWLLDIDLHGPPSVRSSGALDKRLGSGMSGEAGSGWWRGDDLCDSLSCSDDDGGSGSGDFL